MADGLIAAELLVDFLRSGKRASVVPKANEQPHFHLFNEAEIQERRPGIGLVEPVLVVLLEPLGQGCLGVGGTSLDWIVR